jgi:NtrC-family two-component system sensor histidine kinase KinB
MPFGTGVAIYFARGDSMIGLRTKLSIGFGSILVIVAGIGIMIMAQLSGLGEAIDIILRENYRSVVACQNMKEALERIDSGVLIKLNDNQALGDSLIASNRVLFESALSVEKNNITLPGEQSLVDEISLDAQQYFALVKSMQESKLSSYKLKIEYYSKLMPQFIKTKEQAQKILILNQNNMNQENNHARKQANSAKNRMILVILTCCVLSLVFSLLTQIWVLRPVNRLIESIEEVSAGNLDLVLHKHSKDEVGLLTSAFNHMTEALRERKRSDNMALEQTKQMTQEVISAISSAIAITDAEGNIEIATESAQKLLRMKIGSSIFDTNLTWLPQLYNQAISSGVMAEYPSDRGYIQTFSDFNEYFYQPVVVPLTHGNANQRANRAVILFRDMTQSIEQQEMKHSVISTVSHQLKTPLTSMRMSIHLLLDERLGTWNNKQLELLQAAQEESERLAGIVDDLLDIHRINSDHQLMEMKLTDPDTLIHSSLSPMISEAKNKGVELKTVIADHLPLVNVDVTRFAHVFTNIITNALRFTPAGGCITIAANSSGDMVRFSITDTGCGISPEHLSHIFEQFYRVPNADNHNGAGLGLAIAKEIVLAHGGEIGVQSELNQGSTFWFELPVVLSSIPRIKVNLKGSE